MVFAHTDDNSTKSKVLTRSPGATISGLMRPSKENPRELKNDTVSMPVARFVPSVTFPSSPVQVMRVPPDVLAPTANTFLASEGDVIVHESRTVLPLLPAAKIKRLFGC